MGRHSADRASAEKFAGEKTVRVRIGWAELQGNHRSAGLP